MRALPLLFAAACAAPVDDSSSRGKLLVILRGEAFRVGCGRNPTYFKACNEYAMDLAQNGTEGVLNMQAACFKSMKAKVVEHAQSIGWDVTVFADVFVPDPTLRPLFSKLMVREGLVRSLYGRTPPGIRVTEVSMSTQMESKLAALRWAQQEAVEKPDAYLFLRPDVQLKQLLRLPTPERLGDWIMQPFQEGDMAYRQARPGEKYSGFKHMPICQNASSGMPMVSDLATLVPSVRMYSYARWLDDMARELMLNRQLETEMDSTRKARERKAKELGLPRPAKVRPAGMTKIHDMEHNLCDGLEKVRFFLDTCHNSNTMLQWNPLLRIAGRPEAPPVMLQKKGGVYNGARMPFDKFVFIQSRPCVSEERTMRTRVSRMPVEQLEAADAMEQERQARVIAEFEQNKPACAPWVVGQCSPSKMLKKAERMGNNRRAQGEARAHPSRVHEMAGHRMQRLEQQAAARGELSGARPARRVRSDAERSRSSNFN